jgi:hypothetical protein
VANRERLYSAEEVERLLAEAGRLERRHGREPPAHRSFTLAEVEQIASEAGLDAKAVREAAESLANAPVVLESVGGIPRRYVHERRLSRELGNEDIQALLATCRQRLTTPGEERVVGRSTHWRGTLHSGGLVVEVQFVPEDAGTTLRIEGVSSAPRAPRLGAILGTGLAVIVMRLWRPGAVIPLLLRIAAAVVFGLIGHQLGVRRAWRKSAEHLELTGDLTAALTEVARREASGSSGMPDSTS